MKVKIYPKEMEVFSTRFHCPQCGILIIDDAFKENDRIKCGKCDAEFRITESPERYFLDLLDESVGEVELIPPLEKKIEEALG